LVQGFGVDEPEILLVTVTPVPEGVKLTFPGPSVTFVYDAVTFGVGSKMTLSSVTLLMYEELPRHPVLGVAELGIFDALFRSKPYPCHLSGGLVDSANGAIAASTAAPSSPPSGNRRRE
jgi:hypothetical protein